MTPLLEPFASQWPLIQRALVVLPLAALLGAAVAWIRPVGRDLAPRAWQVVHASVVVAIVGAVIMMIVGDSLARAVAMFGAAGLARHRPGAVDPGDAVVMLVALALGLAAGSGLFALAVVAGVFVIATLWALDALQPPARLRCDLTIAARDFSTLRPQLEHVLRRKVLAYELWSSSPDELRYEVVVPFERRIRTLARLIRQLDRSGSASVECRVKRRQVA